jgi:hypothetical protein
MCLFFKPVTAMFLEQTEQSNIATNTPANVLVCQMLLEQGATCVLHITGKLLVEKDVNLVNVTRLVQEVSSVMR